MLPLSIIWALINIIIIIIIIDIVINEVKVDYSTYLASKGLGPGTT